MTLKPWRRLRNARGKLIRELMGRREVKALRGIEQIKIKLQRQKKEENVLFDTSNYFIQC